MNRCDKISTFDISKDVQFVRAGAYFVSDLLLSTAKSRDLYFPISHDSFIQRIMNVRYHGQLFPSTRSD